jgi:hypothetical protein
METSVMPDEQQQFTVGGLVWVWTDVGRWCSGTVVDVSEAAVKVRLSKIHHPHHIEVTPDCLRPRNFLMHGADRPRIKIPKA